MVGTESVVQLAQLGMTGILLFILGLLWKEHQLQSAYIRDMLTKLADDHEDLAAGLRAFVAGDSEAAIRLRRLKVVDEAAELAASRVLAEADVQSARRLAVADVDAAVVRAQAVAALKASDAKRRTDGLN